MEKEIELKIILKTKAIAHNTHLAMRFRIE